MLESGYVRFEIVCTQQKQGGRLELSVIDSGAGFNFKKLMHSERSDTNEYHGRGTSLLMDLCDSVEYFGIGNHVKAVFLWNDLHSKVLNDE